MGDFVLPSDTQRIVILGKTGSGKTQAAAWQLSQRSFNTMPWVVFDFKGDELLGQINMTEISITAKAPKKSGLYVVRPTPDQEEEVEEFLWDVWSRENVGIYIDEGYMVGNSAAFRALLTQGRSKKIPMIVLSQRPVWLSRFVFSEADFFQVFWLNDARDRKTVQSFMPVDVNKRLADYYSLYYDVGRDRAVVLRPVPDRNKILEIFSNRLRPKKKIL